MGLFSSLSKNKQEPVADEGAYVSRDDDDGVAARARSKRASSAGEPAARRSKEGRAAADPVLPEKKRARRRLVGAIALALAVAIGLPMILDSEPKPLSNDIDFRIPSKEKAPPQPMPAPVATSESLGDTEQLIDPDAAEAEEAPKALVPAPERRVAEVRTAPVKAEVKRPQADAKPEVKEVKTTVKPADRASDTKPPVRDSERALAILEDKPVKAAATQKYTVQVAALTSEDRASELQARLKSAGIASFTQKGSSGLIKVRVGPFTKDEGDKVRAKLAKLGLSGSVVPH